MNSKTIEVGLRIKTLIKPDIVLIITPGSLNITVPNNNATLFPEYEAKGIKFALLGAQPNKTDMAVKLDRFFYYALSNESKAEANKINP